MRQHMQGAGTLLVFLPPWSVAAFGTPVGVFERPAAHVKDRCHALGAAAFQIPVFCARVTRLSDKGMTQFLWGGGWDNVTSYGRARNGLCLIFSKYFM